MACMLISDVTYHGLRAGMSAPLLLTDGRMGNADSSHSSFYVCSPVWLDAPGPHVHLDATFNRSDDTLCQWKMDT